MASPLAESSPARPLKLLVLAKYGDRAASTRQRFSQMVPYLSAENITLEIRPLFDNRYLDGLLTAGTHYPARIMLAYVKRLRDVLHANRYDGVIVQYELFPYLPGWFESLIRLVRVPVFYDMDDAIFHQYDTHRHPVMRRLLARKLDPLLRRVNLAFCGNDYLADYVRARGTKVEILPTTLDVTQYVPSPHTNSRLRLGWIGSPSTWNFFRHLHGFLAAYVREKNIEFLVVGAGHAASAELPFTFREWEEPREVADIQSMDIGIMPLPDAAWAKGKCGYKLIQYMACGLPVIASPVGVNSRIVSEGENGFLASSEEEWRRALDTLIADAALRQRMGEAGRASIEKNFAVQIHGPRLAQVLRKLCSQL